MRYNHEGWRAAVLVGLQVSDRRAHGGNYAWETEAGSRWRYQKLYHLQYRPFSLGGGKMAAHAVVPTFAMVWPGVIEIQYPREGHLLVDYNNR